MKAKAIFLVVLAIGLFSCEDKEPSNFDKLTDGIWSLETLSNDFETIEFKTDKTYIITTMLNDIGVSGRIPVNILHITGEWSYSNNKITFETAYVDLTTDSDELDIQIVDGESIGSFYGYSDDDTSQIQAITPGFIRVGTDTVVYTSEFTPYVWTIEELTDEILIVKSDSKTLQYSKSD